MAIFLRSVAVFFISMLPLVESKGAILLARLWRMPFLLSGTLCVVGSYLPVPVLLYRQGDEHVHAAKKHLNIPATVQKYIERYGCWALLVTIAIPFTGMGCWVGALLARATHMEKHKAAVCIFIGNLIAVVIMTGCIHGIVTAIGLLLAKL